MHKGGTLKKDLKIKCISVPGLSCDIILCIEMYLLFFLRPNISAGVFFRIIIYFLILVYVVTTRLCE